MEIPVKSSGGRRQSACTLLALGPEVQLTAVVVTNGPNRKIFAVGEAGTILTSGDDGQHWKSQNLGGSKLMDIVQSEKTKQLLVVGEGGRFLISDDEGESWYTNPAGTTNDLVSIASIPDGDSFYAFGIKGSFVKYLMGSERFDVQGVRVDHVLGKVHAHVTLPGLKPSPAPQFTVLAVRSREADRTIPIELPTEVSPPEIDGNQWTSSFDLSALSPHPGESFNLQLRLKQGSFSRCFPLPRLTVIPLVDFQENKKWIVPSLLFLIPFAVLTVLLYTKPLLILYLYRKASIYDLLDKSGIPGAGVIKVLLTGTLLPIFAFHKRTLDAWVESNRAAFQQRWKRYFSATVPQGGLFYIPLPVQVEESAHTRLVTEPSAQSLGRLTKDRKAIEILGSGGIGKTTLLLQFASWLFEIRAAKSGEVATSLPVLIDGSTGSLPDYVKRKVDNITEGETSPELMRKLLSNLRLLLFIDGFSELNPDTQKQLVQGFEELSVKGLVLSSRRPIEIPSLERINLYPKALDSKTLLYFITALLSRLPDDKAHLNTMQLQLELGNRVVRAMASEGQEIPLTPLLVTLYVDRAVDLLSQNQGLDNLPSTIAEAYFDFLRHLFRDTGQIGTDRMLAAVKIIAKLSLGDRYVPTKFSFDSALRSVETVLGASSDAGLRGLMASGILIEEELGLGRSLRFVFDPLAEICAAYAYVEDFGTDMAKWEQFLARLKQLDSAASGFRAALALVAQTYGPKGLCPVDLPT
jgi:hypothetical protein